MKKLLLLILIGIFLISFVSAAQQSLGTFKKDSCIQLIQTCSNCTYNNLTYIYQTGDAVLYNISDGMTKQGSFYNYTFCNTTGIGEYIVNGLGDPDGEKTSWTYNFYVNLRGIKITIGEAIVYGIAVLIIFGMMMACIFGIKQSDKLYMKFGLGYLAYLFLTIISYITWITSTSMIETAFIDRFFYWIFIILTIGFIPLFLGTVAYYVYTVLTIKPIMEMVNRGVPEDRAYADQIRKDTNSKGWWI